MENVDSIIKLQDLEHDDIKSVVQVFFFVIITFFNYLIVNFIWTSILALIKYYT